MRMNRRFPLENSVSLAVSGGAASPLPRNPWLKDVLREYLDQRPRGIHINENDVLFLLAGTNDILRRVSSPELKKSLRSLIELALRNFSKVVVARVPPIPLLSTRANARIDDVNRWLASFCLDPLRVTRITLVDSFSPFLNSNTGRIKLHLYERYYPLRSGRSPRRDLIHLNRKGLRILFRTLMEALQ